MSCFKAYLIIILFSTISNYSYSQVDTAEVDDDKETTPQIVQVNKIMPHKRGVYKTYEEYINNTPSIDAEFTLKPLQISRNNPLVAEADVDYAGKRPKRIWGISDGEHVYLRAMSGQFFKNHYFRLQCDGPRPFIYLVEKPVFIAGGLGLVVMASVAATSAVLPPFVTLMVVRDNTKDGKAAYMATNSLVKSVIKEYPDLLEAYKNEPNHKKAIKVKYITEYNKRKLEKVIVK